MRLRVSFLLMIVILLGSAIAAVSAVERRLAREYQTSVEFTPGDLSTADVIQGSDDIGSKEWGRENMYINISALERQGRGPFLTTENYTPRTKAQLEDVRILVVGDSYTYGVGAADPDMIWHRRVYQLLEETYPDTSIDMMTLAKPGASLIEEVEWLTDDLLERIDPDIILFGHVTNDATPSGRERSICGSLPRCETLASANLKEYTTCIAGDGSQVARAINGLFQPFFPLVGQNLLLRYCDRIRVEREADGSTLRVEDKGDPYYQLVLKSVDRLAEIDRTFPVVSAMLNDRGQPSPFLRNLKVELEARGVTTVEQKQSLFDRSTVDEPALRVNPADTHPGNFVTTRYAQDVVSTLKRTHNDIFGQGTVVQRPPRRLISSHLPVNLSVEETSSTGVDVVSAPGAIDLYGTATNYSEAQETPCALIGRTHIRLMLDPNRAEEQDILIDSLSDDITVYAVGYDDASLPTVRIVGQARAGASFEIDLGPGESGLLLSPTDAQPCDLARRLAAPELRFTLSLR